MIFDIEESRVHGGSPQFGSKILPILQIIRVETSQSLGGVVRTSRKTGPYAVRSSSFVVIGEVAMLSCWMDGYFYLLNSLEY